MPALNGSTAKLRELKEKHVRKTQARLTQKMRARRKTAKGAALADGNIGKARKAPAKRTASVLCEEQEESPEQPSKAETEHQALTDQKEHAAAAAGRGLKQVSQGLPTPAVKPPAHSSMPQKSAHAHALGSQDRAANSEAASASAQQPAAAQPQQSSAAIQPSFLVDRLAAHPRQERAGLPLTSNAAVGAPAIASAPVSAVCSHQVGASAAEIPHNPHQPQAPTAWQAKALAAAHLRAAQSSAAPAADSQSDAQHTSSSAAAAAPQAGLPIPLPLMNPYKPVKESVSHPVREYYSPCPKTGTMLVLRLAFHEPVAAWTPPGGHS